MKSVLVVDDETVILRLFQRVLKGLDCRVQSAESVRSAMAALDHEDFDLLITDLRLSDGSGTDVVNQFRASRPERPVMIVTGSLTPGERLSDVEGNQPFQLLLKPVSIAAFREAVAAALAN